MGTLRKWELKDNGCNIFFETGTGTAASLEHALNNGKFDKLYSVEINTETAEKAKKKFNKNNKVTILNSDSISALKLILPKLNNDDKLFFFLDAHFPGEVSSHFDGYDKENFDHISLPLEEELKLIKSIRPETDDIIVVDDLRIYEDADYESGNLPSDFQDLPEKIRNIDFAQNIFNTRIIQKLLFGEGYLLITPKKSAFTLKKLSNFYRIKQKLIKLFN